MALSDRQIRALKPQSERYSVWDGQGLGLRIGVGGRKTWIFVYQYRNRRRMMQLGVYPAMPLAQARQAHVQAKILLTQGIDPIEAARGAEAAAREPLTVRRLGERYIALYARQRRSNWRDDERALERDVYPFIGDTLAVDIKRKQVLDLLHEVAERASVAANRLKSLLVGIWNWAVDQGQLDSSPLVGLKTVAPEKPRTRALAEHEIVQLWARLEALKISWTTREALRLQLRLAMRSGEVAGGRWSEIDWQEALWVLPANRTKQRKIHIIPLPHPAIAHLQQLHRISGRGCWLFPSHRRETGDSGTEAHLTRQAMSRAVDRKQKNVGLAELWTPHDLRRTTRTQLGKLGVEWHIAERVLGHAVPGLTKTYDQYDYLDEKREALDQWNERLQQLIGAAEPNGGGNVVRIDTGGR